VFIDGPDLDAGSWAEYLAVLLHKHSGNLVAWIAPGEVRAKFGWPGSDSESPIVAREVQWTT